MKKSDPNDTNHLRDAFDVLCAKHGEDARRFARLKLGAALRRRVDSEDVRQEVLLEAWRLFQARPGMRGLAGDGFVRWMGEILRRKVLSLARHHVGAEQRSVHKEERQSGSEDRAGGPSPSEIAMNEEALSKLDQAISSLSPREQEVVRLVHIDGRRLADAARQMGKTPGATSVLLCQALEKLETKMVLSKRRKP